MHGVETCSKHDVRHGWRAWCSVMAGDTVLGWHVYRFFACNCSSVDPTLSESYHFFAFSPSRPLSYIYINLGVVFALGLQKCLFRPPFELALGAR